MLTKKHNLSIGKKLGLAPKEKAKDNNVINDVPSVDQFLEQKKIRPATPKSTHGLLGFANDAEDAISAILLGHNPSEADLIAMTDNELFGTLQMDTQTDGGVQTKSVQVTREFVNTLDQEKIAMMSAEQQTELLRIIKKFGFKNDKQPLHQLTHDEVVDPQGTNDPKKTVGKGSGMRRFFDDINMTVNGKLRGLSIVKDKANKQKNDIENASNVNTETAAPAFGTGLLPGGERPAPQDTDLDRPFFNKGTFA